MLEDGLSISQDLDLVGKSVESVRQRVSKMKLVHAHGERVGGEEKRRRKNERWNRRALGLLVPWPRVDGRNLTGCGERKWAVWWGLPVV